MAIVLTNVSPAVSTVDASSYAFTSFLPAAQDLIVAMALVTGTVEPNPTLTANANGLTFTKIAHIIKGADSLFAFVANQKVGATPANMVLTLGLPTDGGTACLPMIARLAGMILTGPTAFRQIKGVNNGTLNAAPAVTFDAAPLTANAQIFACITDASTAKTPPLAFTERRDTATATPTAGGYYASVNSGQTGQTITLLTSNLGNWSALGLEITAGAVQEIPGGGGPAAFEGWGIPI